jgi:hypothetical protein
MGSGAVFDATRHYRYTLWREWDGTRSRVAIVMLNPSVADEMQNDPTIRRCIAFARSWGYGSVEIVNLFAYRTPYPKKLSNATEPIGIDNDKYLLQASNRSSRLVFAWGNWGYLRNRAWQVHNLLAGLEGYCLGLTLTGQPRHPLYLAKDTQLIPYRIEP